MSEELTALAEDFKRIERAEAERADIYKRITALVDDGVPGVEIADALGLTRQRIYQIIKQTKKDTS